MYEQAMAYQGEDICFTIIGNEEMNLDSTDFTFITYPCNNPSALYSVAKTACEKAQENVYIATIPQSYTKTATPGPYSIEIYDKIGKAIYQKRNAYIMNTSATKNII